MSKNLVKIFLANIFYLLISVLSSFLLPKYLDIDNYAMLKTFTLYVGYAGFLSLGYTDGIYLKYGGSESNEIEDEKLNTSLKSYIILELLICFAIGFVGLILQNPMSIYIASGALFINIIGYYKNYSQATGEVSLYSKSLNYQLVLQFIFNIALLFIFKLYDFRYYIFSQILAGLIITIFLTCMLFRHRSIKKGHFDIHEIKENVSSGLFLMVGNFASSIFTGIDRFFVKYSLDNTNFSQYSFAVSIENIFDTFTTPISVYLYNVIIKRKMDKTFIMHCKKNILLWSFLILAGIYPLRYIITIFLPNYVDIIPVIIILVSTYAFYGVIKGINVNLYKCEKKQNKYFAVMLINVTISIITNVVALLIFKNVVAYALATLITVIIWYIYTEIERKDIRFSFIDYLFIIILLGVYYLTNLYINEFFGLMIYLFIYILACMILYNSTLKNDLANLKILFKKEK